MDSLNQSEQLECEGDLEVLGLLVQQAAYGNGQLAIVGAEARIGYIAAAGPTGRLNGCAAGETSNAARFE